MPATTIHDILAQFRDEELHNRHLGDARFSSGIIISTTDKWGPNAEKRLQNPTKPVNRLRVQDLDDSPIDWSKFSLKNPQALSLKKKKTLRPHQFPLNNIFQPILPQAIPPLTPYLSFVHLNT